MAFLEPLFLTTWHVLIKWHLNLAAISVSIHFFANNIDHFLLLTVVKQEEKNL